MAALGLEMKDLFSDTGRAATKQKKEIVATYDYVDEQGKLLYQVVRFQPKDFRQRRPDGNGGWIWSLGDTRRVLHRLPQVLEAVKNNRWVLVVEGEKDVHTLERLGFVATTNAGGAGKWRGEYSESLRGAHVAVVPDNDGPGRKHAEAVKVALEGVAASVKIIHLPDLPERGDVSNWVAAGGTAEELKALVTAPPATLANLLERISGFVSNYVVFANKQQLHAVALWIAHTHLIEQFDCTAYLSVQSPEKRSGKTRLFECLELLVKNPWRSITPSEAVLYRKIEAHNPTILMDEVDAIWNYKTASQHEGLRAAVNAGYRRGATVDRCAGPRGDNLESFAVFCAKALAGIGKLPDTISDRAITINMVRKTKQEKVQRFRRRDAKKEASLLYADIAVCLSDLKLSGYPEMPDGLNDRAEEVWESLVMIADAAGGKWPERARKAALALSGEHEPEDDSLGVRLLADCQTVFEKTGKDRLPSKDLLGHLAELEESPWNDIGLTVRKLASMLKRYDVKSKQLNLESSNPRGYPKTAFLDAWKRYSASKVLEVLKPADRAENSHFQSACGSDSKHLKNSQKPADRAKQALQADKTPNIGAGEKREESKPPGQTLPLASLEPESEPEMEVDYF